MTDTNPPADELLRRTESYLSALHGSVARHDNLAANYGCAGCELRDQIAAALRAATIPAAALSDAEQTMLAYALDQAQERIWVEGGFTEEDQAAVDSLRRRTVLPAPADRAAILREAADTVDAMNEGCGRRQPCTSCNTREDVADALRRLADAASGPGRTDGETQPWYAIPGTEEDKLVKASRMAKAASTPPVAPPEWDFTKEWPMRHKRARDRRIHATAPFSVNDVQKIWTACGKPVGKDGLPMSHMPVDCRDCRRATAPAAVSQPDGEA